MSRGYRISVTIGLLLLLLMPLASADEKLFWRPRDTAEDISELNEAMQNLSEDIDNVSKMLLSEKYRLNALLGSMSALTSIAHVSLQQINQTLDKQLSNLEQLPDEGEKIVKEIEELHEEARFLFYLAFATCLLIAVLVLVMIFYFWRKIFEMKTIRLEDKNDKNKK